MSTKKKSSKQIYKTDVPFTPTTWPELTPLDSAIIVKKLCQLLAPIGHHRKAQKSTDRKRKREQEDDDASDVSPPPLSKSITIGLNSTTQYLERLASRSAPLASKKEPPSDQGHTHVPGLSLVFLPFASLVPGTGPARPAVPLQYQHLPILAQLAARSTNLEAPDSMTNQTLLVPLPRAAEKQLKEALGLPRVSALGLVEGTPSSEELLSFCREKVEPMTVPWIKEALSGKDVMWKGTKISAQKG